MNHPLPLQPSPAGRVYLSAHLSVPTADVLFCEGDGNYTHVHFRMLPKLTLPITLRILHDRLGATEFLRPNRSTVINSACIAGFDYHEIRLRNGLAIPIARRRRRFVRQHLQDHPVVVVPS